MPTVTSAPTGRRRARRTPHPPTPRLHPGHLANSGGQANTFTAILNLLPLGALPASAALTTSIRPANAANDTATTSCTAVTSLFID